MTKTIIVTGATGNLGQAIVKRFLNDGYRVVATVFPQSQRELLPDHPMLEPQVLDLLDEASVLEQFQQWTERYGSIDAGIFTAGGFAAGGIRDTAGQDLLTQYRLNFETTYHLARPLFLYMMERGRGRLFFTGSRPGAAAEQSKGMVAYGLSKSLLFRLAELLNDEARGTHVVASVLVPSTIDTPQNRKAMPKADFSQWVKPESVADILAFYCSDAAADLREPIIKVYGGA